MERGLLLTFSNATSPDAVKTARDAVHGTSGDRTHSPTLELDPLPPWMIFRQLGSRVGR